jgi:hypothetical protein
MSFRLLFSLVAAVIFTAACGKSDASITDSVKAQLVSDESVKALNIDVETRDRVVTLTGTAESEGERTRAFEIARAIDGVVEVVNNITVSPRTDQQTEAATGTAGDAAPRAELPPTASLMPIIALIGTLSLVAGFILWRVRLR